MSNEMCETYTLPGSSRGHFGGGFVGILLLWCGNATHLRALVGKLGPYDTFLNTNKTQMAEAWNVCSIEAIYAILDLS